MGSKSKGKRNRPTQLITFRDFWCSTPPLVMMLEILKADLLKRRNECKIIGGTDRAKCEGALAIIDTLSNSIRNHTVFGDLIPLKTPMVKKGDQPSEGTEQPDQATILGPDGRQHQQGTTIRPVDAPELREGSVPSEREDGGDGEGSGSTQGIG